MFAAGVIPGVLLWFRVTVYNAVRNYFQPELAPPLPPEERGNWSERFAALRAVLLPMGIILMVLGSILAGIATPTEAAALGVLGSLISAILPPAPQLGTH